MQAALLAALLIFLSGSGPSPARGVKSVILVPGALTVATINLAKATDVERVAAELRRHEPLASADILLLQEVVQRKQNERSTADALGERLGYRHVAFGSPDLEGTTLGLAILSRYPIEDTRIRTLRPFNLVYHSRRRIALSATVRAPFGPVRVVDAHLDTRINARDRVEQLKPVIEDARQFPAPRLIGGDFNTNNIRWLANVVPVPFLQVQTKAVERLMAQYGFETPFRTTGPTHDFFGFRLDWIFEQGLRPRAAGVQPLAFSDHHAVWAQFQP